MPLIRDQWRHQTSPPFKFNYEYHEPLNQELILLSSPHGGAVSWFLRMNASHGRYKGARGEKRERGIRPLTRTSHFVAGINPSSNQFTGGKYLVTLRNECQKLQLREERGSSKKYDQRKCKRSRPWQADMGVDICGLKLCPLP